MRSIDADEFSKQEVLEKLRTAEFDDEIKDAVEKIPTTYDVDKVEEKITKLQLKVQEKFYNVEDEEYAVMLRGRLRGIADCLEIVKSGGDVND